MKVSRLRPPNEDLDIEYAKDVVKVSVVLKGKSGKLEVKEGDAISAVASAAFKNSISETGWSFLTVSTNGDFDDELQAVAAGMAEGYITANIIRQYYNTMFSGYCEKDHDWCKDKLIPFVQQSDDWVANNVKSNLNDAYWYHVNLIQKQLDGLYLGYKASPVAVKYNLTRFDFKLLQLSAELDALEAALDKKDANVELGSSKRGASCSALVKVLENDSDIVISHVTWNNLNAMLRIYKKYNMPLRVDSNSDKRIPGYLQSFSSYPAITYSEDDFYILSSGMVTQETTLGNWNKDIWKYVVPQTVPASVRSVLANRLATTGSTWAELFQRHNSGTYNNQWMILDYNLFTPGEPLKPNTLWILEQAPGTVQMADKTMLLEDQGFWSSYNVAYFPDIYNLAGFQEMKDKYGDFYDYNLCPRAQIFKRDHGKVVDMESFMSLMRYNDYKHDPLSRCKCTPNGYSAAIGISARDDLNPKDGTYDIPAVGHRRHGGTDCKATNFKMSKEFIQYIVGGPMFDESKGIPPFKWSDSGWPRPIGQPDLFNFKPFMFDWNNEKWAKKSL